MSLVVFHVTSAPVAWQRAGLAKGGRHHFTRPETRAWEREVAIRGKAAMRGRPLLEGPVELVLVFLLPVPASWPNWKRRAAFDGEVVPTAKPDFDNLAKGVSDALNGVCWADDAQVVDSFTRKRYAPTPSAVVQVRPLNLLPAQVSRRPKA